MYFFYGYLRSVIASHVNVVAAFQKRRCAFAKLKLTRISHRESDGPAFTESAILQVKADQSMFLGRAFVCRRECFSRKATLKGNFI